MAFPSSFGTKLNDLAAAWNGARQWSGLVKQRAQAVRSLSLAGTLGASNILEFSTLLADAKVALQTYAAVPGIGAYAQEQVSDPALNVATEFTTMVSAIDGCTAWIVANFPKDGSGFLLAATLAATGRQVDRLFAAAATATFRTQLDALIATID